MKKLSGNENGYLLVITMLLLIIIFTMGGVLLNISTLDFKQSEKNKNEIKAYYLARAGAELMADAIINGSIDMGTASSTDYLVSKNSKMIIKEINVSPESAAEDNELYLVEATGEVNGDEENIKLVLKAEDIANLFDRAVFTRAMIDLDAENVYVTGAAIESKGNIEDKNEILPEEMKIDNSSREMPPMPYPHIFPDLTTPGGIINDTTYIDEDSYYDEINIWGTPGTNLYLDTTNGTTDVTTDDIDIQLLVDNIEIKNELIVEGTGRVFIFINESGTFKTPSANSSQVFVFLADGASFTIQSGGDFHGYIYGPGATVTMQSAAGSSLYGAIIADELRKNSSSNEFQGAIEYIAPDSIGDVISPVYLKGEWRQ